MSTESNPAQRNEIDISSVGASSLSLAVPPANVYMNVQQQLIIVTEDKIRICLHEHLDKMGKR
jgi:hypothetical protein